MSATQQISNTIDHAELMRQWEAIERETGIKHEIRNGEFFAMAGGSFKHNALSARANRLLGNLLDHKPCIILSSDQAVQLNDEAYCYPDVSVVCQKPNLDGNTLLNPTLLVEILSPSTSNYDQSEKKNAYLQLPSLQEYLLIAQDRIWIAHYSRRTEFMWNYRVYEDTSELIPLPSLDISLLVAEIYADWELYEDAA